MGVPRKSSEVDCQIETNPESVSLPTTGTVECGDMSKHNRKETVRQETEEIFKMFMDLEDGTDDPTTTAKLFLGSPSLDSQTSIEMSLDFDTNIESDGFKPSSLQDKAAKDETDSESSEADANEASGGENSITDINSREEFLKAARILQVIGDDINKKYIQADPVMKQSLQKVTEEMLSTGAGHVFEESLDQVLNDFNKSTFQEDKYKVALVMLCTRQVVRTMTKAADFSESASVQLVDTAMTYISSHYPNWRRTI